jgi:hypothetical protein
MFKNIKSSVGFEVLTAVVMKAPMYWDIASCSPYKNQRFGGTILRVENKPRKRSAPYDDFRP